MTEEELNMMIQEITMEVPKCDSLVIRSRADANMWDKLAGEIADMKARDREIEIPYA